MAPSNVDYRPLEAINHAWATVMRTALRGLAWPLAALAVGIGIYLSILGKDIRALILTAFYFAYIANLVNKYKNKVWERFAAANGWDLDTATAGENIISPGLKFGHSHEFRPVIKAELPGGMICDLFTYDCTTGHGRSSQTHEFTVAATDLPKQVPHMVLRAKKGDTDLRDDMADSETLKLEGDFNDYFRLQVEDGQEVDVLTVITPDIMQTLVDYSQGEDIEMFGQRLYFIVRDDKRDPDSVKQLVRSVIELSEQLKENIRLATPQKVSQAPSKPPAPIPTVAPAISPSAQPVK